MVVVNSTNVGEGHSSLRELIFEELRNRIVRNELPPGTRMVENQLAEELGVSRNPIREAIRMLEAAGFVRVLPRRGAIVAELSPLQANELFELGPFLKDWRLVSPHTTLPLSRC